MTDRITPAELDALERIVAAGDRACIDGTPMIPLHKDTVRKLVDRVRALEAVISDAIEEIESGAPFTAQGLLRAALEQTP